MTLATILASGTSILPFRKTKFGRNAKNTLLRIGGAYDTLSNEPSDFVFLTGTLPGNTPDAFRVIAEYSADIAHSIGKWIQRTVKSEYYFYTWELQKRGALHFHYCVYCPSVEAKQKILSEFKLKWTSLLDDISKRSQVCLWEGDSRTCWTDRYGTLQAYAQPVRQSVAAYLSGYLSGDKDKHSLDENSPYYPRRWWGASRKTTSLLKALTDEVISEHNNYRGAALEMKRFYEAVSHDTPLSYHYNHKVGVGSTSVSYHPEDKGQEIWQGLQKQMFQHKSHKHIASLIRLCLKAFKMSVPYITAYLDSKSSVQKRLLLDLTDSHLLDSLRRWTLKDTHLRILKEVKSQLHSVLPATRQASELLNTFALIETFLTMNKEKLLWNSHGWLCNSIDLPYTVDIAREMTQSSTTDPDGEGAQGGAAHGSLSPQNSPSQLTLL